MKYLFLVLSLLSAQAYADCTSCDVIFNGKTLRQDMTEAEVLKVAGEPTHHSDLTNVFGAKLGEMWTYSFNGYNKQTILVQINNAGSVIRLKSCIGVLADRCGMDPNGEGD